MPVGSSSCPSGDLSYPSGSLSYVAGTAAGQLGASSARRRVLWSQSEESVAVDDGVPGEPHLVVSGGRLIAGPLGSSEKSTLMRDPTSHAILWVTRNVAFFE